MVAAVVTLAVVALALVMLDADRRWTPQSRRRLKRGGQARVTMRLLRRSRPPEFP